MQVNKSHNFPLGDKGKAMIFAAGLGTKVKTLDRPSS